MNRIVVQIDEATRQLDRLFGVAVSLACLLDVHRQTLVLERYLVARVRVAQILASVCYVDLLQTVDQRFVSFCHKTL